MKEREATIVRKTNETDVQIILNLDREGSIKISTGLNFFDHMLQQLYFHAGWSGEVKVVGDLHIDEHHTIEDTAIALGEALFKALETKRGIERYGFVLPMDESCSMVAVDLGGRIDLVWNVPFTRERVGDVPTELFKHFFKSLCDNAKITLHVNTYGENDHHKIESVFKAVGRALRMAIAKDERGILPTTKGIL